MTMKMETEKAAVQPVNIISNRNFEANILSSDRPVLLMCVSGVRAFAEQEQVLRQLSGRCRKLIDICCLEEDFINGFKEMYNIKGTPVFLLFHKGQEKGRMLGRADKDCLEAFLTRNLPQLATLPS